MFVWKEVPVVLLFCFLIILAGSLLGKIRVCNVSLGTAGIFLAGLAFGHFGVTIPQSIQMMGIAVFISAVGIGAGPGFLERLRKNGPRYLLLSLLSAGIGSLVCLAMVRCFHLEMPLALGIMTGAFTTSPGFAAAKDAVGEAGAAQVAAGYGIAYPVGVVCKVLFIQLAPRFLRADMALERQKIALKKTVPSGKADAVARLQVDSLGLFPLSFAIVLGMAAGSFVFPLPGGNHFSLGTVGGPLAAGLLVGSMGHLERLDLSCDEKFLASMKLLGVSLFFAGAGTEGGRGVAAIIRSYGLLPCLCALVCVLVPLILGFAAALLLFRLPLLNALSAMAASMTCTPSLAMLTQVAGTDDVAAAYATVYPVALVILVLVVQVLALL